MRFWYFFTLLWNVFAVALLGIFGRFHGVFFFAYNFVTNHRGIITQFDIEARLSWSGCSALATPRLVLPSLDWQLMKLWPQCDCCCLTFVDTSRCHDWRPRSIPALPLPLRANCQAREAVDLFSCPERNWIASLLTPQFPHHIISSLDLMNFKWCGNFFPSPFFPFFLFLFRVIRHQLTFSCLCSSAAF